MKAYEIMAAVALLWTLGLTAFVIGEHCSQTQKAQCALAYEMRTLYQPRLVDESTAHWEFDSLDQARDWARADSICDECERLDPANKWGIR